MLVLLWRCLKKINLIALNMKNENVVSTAENVYNELSKAGYEVLFDDRDARVERRGEKLQGGLEKVSEREISGENEGGGGGGGE